MADQDDIAALRRGEKDLVNADLRDANFDALLLSHRDFSGAKFDRSSFVGATLRRSIMTGASFIQTKLGGANLDGCSAASTAFVFTDFSQSILARATFRNAIFNKSKLVGADLRGADFTNARLVEDNDLTEAISDENTRFDGAYVLRPMIRNPVFRFYRLERGRLIRKTEKEVDAPITGEKNVSKLEVLEAAQGAKESLTEIRRLQDEGARQGMMGHNGPPSDAALSPEELQEAELVINSITNEVESPAADEDSLRVASEKLRMLGKKVFEWLGRHGNLFSEEFARESGKNLAKPTTLATLYLAFSGQLGLLIEAVVQFFGV